MSDLSRRGPSRSVTPAKPRLDDDGKKEKRGAAAVPPRPTPTTPSAPSSPSKFDSLVNGEWTFTVPFLGVTTSEFYLPVLVLLVALFTRLYKLDEPPGVVFDESHFGRFTNQYTARTYFFDIHPPLGKLVFWLMGRLVGYNHPPGLNPAERDFLSLPSDCRYEHISEQYHPECKYVWLRLVSALHSSVTVLLLFLIGRRWTRSPKTADGVPAGVSSGAWGGLLSAGLLLFDMLNHIEGRLVLMDVQLVFWCTASLYIAMCWWDRLNESAEAQDREADGVPLSNGTRPMDVRERMLWAIGLGVACGNAFSVKMTGLATPAIIGLETALGIWFLKRPARWLDMIVVLVSALTVYSAYFALHFHLLTRHGDGDSDFMNLAFQKTIKENPNYDPTAVWEGFWYTMVTLNIRMVVHNANILEPHPWQSKWHEWVFNLRGVSYYGKDLPGTYTAHMYLIGNHFIHWAVIVGLVTFAGMALLYLRYSRFPEFHALRDCAVTTRFFAQTSFCLAVYILNLAPYMGVARSTFIYHYMPALVYGELIVARVLEQLAGPKSAATMTKLFLAFIGLYWAYYTPWIYGAALTNDGHERRRLVPRWN